jgi:DNA gyrase/topoisomerase IV subunit A
LGASWNNNVPLFEQSGNFGTRLIQESAASRYIYALLSNDFKKYFCDESVLTKNIDIESPEPMQYLPIIPWVLVNGIEGIAVGFACRFLPHDPKSIAKACIKELDGKLNDNYVIDVKFPGFKGEIIQENHDKIIIRGLVEKIKKNTWLITEVPWGYDREKYFNLLDKMNNENKISDFEDMSDASGFKFKIKLDAAQDLKCENDPISYFKLEKTYTENYTALDENGKIIIFDNKISIIKKFVEFRLKKVQERILFDINKIKSSIYLLETKLKFISDVLDDNIEIKKLSRQNLIELVSSRYAVDKDISSNIISIPIYSMTQDSLESIQNQIDKSYADLSELEKSDHKLIYRNMLKSI